jgi:hypothetical protein
MPHCKNNELSLTIYSAHRQPFSTISNAKYILDNGPLYVKAMAVRSATLYNTTHNINIDKSIITWSAESLADGDGVFSFNIPVGFYTGDELALVLQNGMISEMTPFLSNNTLVVTFDDVSNNMSFVFDNLHDYSSNEWLIKVHNLYLEVEVNMPSGNTVIKSTPVSGTYRGSDLAQLLQNSYNTRMHNRGLPAADLGITFDDTNKRFSFVALDNIYQYSIRYASVGNIMGLNNQNTHFINQTPWTVPNQSIGQIQNLLITSRIEHILSFKNGSVNANRWVSGSVNLGGPMACRFVSTKLSDRNHRTIVNHQDTAFWSMPLTSSYRQLQHYREPQLQWISFDGGVELSEIDIKLTDENGHDLELSNDYILEILIRQTNNF